MENKPVNTVTISIERYDELRGKEVVYDYLRGEMAVNEYASDSERRMFKLPPVTEEERAEAREKRMAAFNKAVLGNTEVE